MATTTFFRSGPIKQRAATLRIRTSLAGDYAGERGFTLLELIVVLAIMGLLIAAIPGFVPRDKGAITLDLATRRMIEGLRKVQSVAMVQNRDQLFSLDVERRQFLPGEGAIPIQVDRSIDLRFVTARKERIGSSIGQIRFFADGSSTGGRIVLEQGGQLSVIEVDWLTLLPRRACCHG